MTPATSVPVEVYLTTSYHPDCDYVDGEVVQRTVGEYDHSKLQARLAQWLLNREDSLGIDLLTEQRVQVAPRRYRIPDVCVLLEGSEPSQILQEPPFLCIEILSTEDRMARVQERVDDYLRMGVRFVWVVDPRSKHRYIYSGDQLEHNRDGLLYTRNPEIRLTIDEVIAKKS